MKARWRLLGHPVHPISVHFPLALLASTTLWDLVGLWHGDAVWPAFAFWSLAVGLLDYASLPDNHPAEKTATRHMLLMLAAVGVYAFSFLLRAVPALGSEASRWGALGLGVVGLGLLGWGGGLGGSLVYRYGVGTEPESEPPTRAR